MSKLPVKARRNVKRVVEAAKRRAKKAARRPPSRMGIWGLEFLCGRIERVERASTKTVRRKAIAIHARHCTSPRCPIQNETFHG